MKPLTLEGELKKVYEEEKNKLGLTDIKIELFLENFEKSAVRKFEDGIYWLRTREEYLQNPKAFRSVCRHELYHIAAGHCDLRYLPTLRNIILDVPATLYEFLGINLSGKPKGRESKIT